MTENLIESTEDAVPVTAVISENFNAVELLGLRELMLRRDRRKLHEYESEWCRQHGKPKFPKFVAAGWRNRLSELRAGTRQHLYAAQSRADA